MMKGKGKIKNKMRGAKKCQMSKLPEPHRVQD
jgi:hypothetical protein